MGTLPLTRETHARKTTVGTRSGTIRVFLFIGLAASKTINDLGLETGGAQLFSEPRYFGRLGM